MRFWIHRNGEPVSLEIVYEEMERNDSIPAPTWYRERT